MRTQDITSVTQHREHLRDHLNQVQATGRPIFITNRSGETEGVLMAPAVYDRMIEELELARNLAMVDRSMRDVKAGNGKDLRQAILDIADELGLEFKA